MRQTNGDRHGIAYGLTTQLGPRLTRLRPALGRGHALVERPDVDRPRRRPHRRGRARRPALVPRHAAVDDLVRAPALVKGLGPGLGGTARGLDRARPTVPARS